MSKIAVGGVVEMLTVSVDDMEEPCLMRLDSLFGNAVCDDLGRMQRQVRGEIVPLVLEGPAKQVESLVTSSDVKDERLERHCGVVRGEAADATEEACGSQAAVGSCGGEVNGGTRKVGPGGSGSGQSEAGQQRDGGQHVHPVLGLTEEGEESYREEQPCKEEFMPEIPATEDSVEQEEMLHIQDGVWRRRVEEAATQQAWLLVNPFFLQVELLEEAHAGVSGGQLGRRKTLRSLCRRLCWVGMRYEVEWCKLYHVYVAEKESERRTRAALRWYQFGAPWEGMAVDVAGARPSMPQGNRRYLPEATGRPPGEEVPQTSPEVVAASQQRWYQPRAGDVQMRWATASALYNPRERRGLAPRLQSNWESPCTALERLSHIICKLDDGTRKRPRIVHVDRMWTVCGGMLEMPLFPGRARMALSKLLPHLGVRTVTTLL